MILSEQDYLAHYGILRRSGRYPWGSGGNQTTRNKNFLEYVDSMKKQGLTNTEIARGIGLEFHEGDEKAITSTTLVAALSIAKNEQKAAKISQVIGLKDKGLSNVEIGKKMGMNESSVRSLLATNAKEKADRLVVTANMLRDEVDSKGFTDVGSGTEQLLGVSRTTLDTSVAMLREEGYSYNRVQTDQLGTSSGKKTTIKVLGPPGKTGRDVYQNLHNLNVINKFSEDGGLSFTPFQYPMSISSKRVGVNWKEDGGELADGVIFVRPGVKDVSLGGSHYAQVRMAVDGTHYLKGMAIYKDDLPHGVDVVFNTNKAKTLNKLDAMKPFEQGNPDNPFGSSFRRQIFDMVDGKPVLSSAMNIVNEEGVWGTWSKTLSSQMLSKQNARLAKQQLDSAFGLRKADLDEITSLTNPAVRKKLLDDFAESADSAAVTLKAAALPRTVNHVILPVRNMKETEIYAPLYRNGERVVLIRHPHGGPFEIPELTVNNNHPEAKSLIGPSAPDAIGISHKVAEKLSGADFDGDTVLVIPNTTAGIKTAPSLAGLKDFNPRERYKEYPGMKVMTKHQKGQEMGDISNLITDMTIKGADHQELAAAVRHSMVVIDAEKHRLNYKQSALDNNIRHLKAKYQGGETAGASTLISRAKSVKYVPERTERPASKGGPVNKDTGEKVYVPTGRTYTKTKVNKRTGEVREVVIDRKTKTTKLEDTKDAHTLSSGIKMESIYADHSNSLKALANEARRESVHTKTVPYSPSAKKAYQAQVDSLNAKLNVAYRNRPLERQAQVIANHTVRQKRDATPNMDHDDLKKLRGQELEAARSRTGAKKQQIQITDHEWDAIQAGAISNHKLEEILKNSDIKRVRELATPRSATLMTSAKTQRAQALMGAGHTQSEVAEILGVSLTTLKSGLKGG